MSSSIPVKEVWESMEENTGKIKRIESREIWTNIGFFLILLRNNLLMQQNIFMIYLGCKK